MYFRLILTFCVFFCGSCSDGEPEGLAQCLEQSDCADVATACSVCPETADQLCSEGKCVDRGEDAVSVYANINIEPRELVVDSLIHALVSGVTADGPFSCEQHLKNGILDSGVSTFHSGYKTLSGGSYHPDVNVGRAPAGDLALVLLGTDDFGGSGEIIAAGCQSGLVASDEDLMVELIDLVQLD